MHILIRNVTDQDRPEILAEFQCNTNDELPNLGDLVSVSAEKKGFQDSQIIFSRNYKITEKEFVLGDGKGIKGIWYEAVRDGEDPN